MKSLKENYEGASSFVKGVFARLRGRKLLLLLVLLATVAYSSVSILRHLHFESDWDLAVFDQGVWQYSHLHAPIVTTRFNYPINQLGDHFHPIIALLAPLYWIVDNANALLVGQAFIIALSIIPVFLFTERRLGRKSAWILTLAYTIFWPIQRTIEFDFHEIAFAIPLIAFAIYFIDVGKAKGYFVCFILMLLTKENMPALVAFFGIYLLLLKRYRDGLISFALGAATFPLITNVVIPFFSGHPYTYWGYNAFGLTLSSAIKTVITKPLMTLKVMLTPEIKRQTIWLIFSPFLGLSLFSPLIVLFIPIFAERFLSERAIGWNPFFHYNATIAPLVSMAAADGLSRLVKLIKRERARSAFILSLSLIILAINLYLLPGLPLWRLTAHDYWRLTDTDRDGYVAMSIIPPDATVTAQVSIATHLAHRPNIYVMSPILTPPENDYMIASSRVRPYPFESTQALENYVAGQEKKGYVKIFERNGWVVLKRPDITPSSPPVLLTLDGSNRAAAINSVTFLLEPFPARTKYPINSNGETRISLFAFNLKAEYIDAPHDIQVIFEDSQGRSYTVNAEAATPVEGPAGLVQVNVRLPVELAGAGDVWVSIKSRGLVSNKALLNVLPDRH